MGLDARQEMWIGNRIGIFHCRSGWSMRWSLRYYVIFCSYCKAVEDDDVDYAKQRTHFDMISSGYIDSTAFQCLIENRRRLFCGVNQNVWKRKYAI